MTDHFLFQIQFGKCYFQLEDWCYFDIRGGDAEEFLNGQLTNNVKILKKGEGQVQCRLNRTGQLQAHFLLGKMAEGHFRIAIKKDFSQAIQDDLNKYIIMEDVSLEPCLDPVWANNFSAESEAAFFSPFGSESFYFANLRPQSEGRNILRDEVDEFLILSGWPGLGGPFPLGKVVNETVFNRCGVDYRKGCFLGQETVSKIESRRGASYFPVLMSILDAADFELGKTLATEPLFIGEMKVGTILRSLQYQGENFLEISLKRDFRIEGKELALETTGRQKISGIIHYIPLLRPLSLSEKSKKIFYMGIEAFQQDKNEEALSLLNHSLLLDPGNTDACESIGVLYGRLGQYQKGIDFMDRLLLQDSYSVMAHTNKSLFYMKIGEIDLAEEEKALATVASFKKLGSEANVKKTLAEEEKKKFAELSRREEMFKAVLEMDSEDVIANYGMGDILFLRGECQLAKNHLEKVLQSDPRYSVGYLLYGKILESLQLRKEAREIYSKGIEVAGKKGDLMPANQMQSLLNGLTR